MAHLLLTVIGRDRTGIVHQIAQAVAAHGGNWVRAELAEVAGTFAGVVQVEVPDPAWAALTRALERLDARITVTTRTVGDATAPPPDVERLVITVLGDDRPGIVRDISRVLAASDLSVDRLTSRTTPAPMAGGELFEAEVQVHPGPGADLDEALEAVRELAGEIQVDVRRR